ncbi:MAG: hypothetical protein KF842_06840 [Caulobacter sp.]|nr:hypothetical protein [Caulobacter sp.]
MDSVLRKEVPEGRWHVVQVNAKRETWAMQNLQGHGHEVYLPTVRKTVRDVIQRRGRRKSLAPTLAMVPAFPGYLFVFVRAAREWPSILTTHGVKGAISTAASGAPSCVPTREVEALKAAEEKGLNELMSEAELDARLAQLDEGDPCRVQMDGALGWLRAVYAGPVDDERCAVLVSLCGRDSRVPISKARVSA